MDRPTEPSPFDPETTPCVTLAGKVWPIPELVWLQLSKCRRELIELNDMINAAIVADDGDGAGDETGAERLARHQHLVGQVFLALDNDDFDRLVMRPVHLGLTALHPTLGRDEFYGWPLTEAERQLAWLTVRRQSGIFAFRDEEPAPGELLGAA
jgi:hypothetical protein